MTQPHSWALPSAPVSEHWLRWTKDLHRVLLQRAAGTVRVHGDASLAELSKRLDDINKAGQLHSADFLDD